MCRGACHTAYDVFLRLHACLPRAGKPPRPILQEIEEGARVTWPPHKKGECQGVLTGALVASVVALVIVVTAAFVLRRRQASDVPHDLNVRFLLLVQCPLQACCSTSCFTVCATRALREIMCMGIVSTQNVQQSRGIRR